MERITHNMQQGSEAWHAFRREHFGASEAAAMLGISPYTSRDDLLKQKATGEEKEVSATLKAVFDRGHETEIGGRALAEAIIGDDLFPVVMSIGNQSASCDGLTMDESTAFEHKQWSEKLAASIVDGTLPEHHQPQCQQVMHVTGATRCLFMTSDGTESKCVWMWVERDQAWIDRIVAGWSQFAEDLAAYQPSEVIPAAVAAPQETLPAVAVQVSGSIAIRDNLQAFGDALKAYVERINNKPQTDDDFATLEKQAKDLKAAEDALTAAESNALAQVSDVDTLRRTVANYREIARQARLTAEKIVKAEKESRRNAIVQGGVTAFREFCLSLAKRFPESMPMALPDVPADFVGSVKGLKTISSIQNAVNTALAQAKLDASALADRISANLRAIAGQEHRHLFNDYRVLSLKAADDLAAVIAQRLATEQKRIDDERARLEAEARAKIEREQRFAEAKRLADEELAKAAAQKAAEAATNLDQEARADQATVSTNGASSTPQFTSLLHAAEAVAQETAPAGPVAASVATIDSGARINLATINLALSPLSVSSGALSLLGIEQAGKNGASVLYRESDLPRICEAIAAHCLRVAGGFKKAA